MYLQNNNNVKFVLYRKNQANNQIEEVALPKNSFNNDGSFFENFKRITDAAKLAQKELEDKLAPPIVTTQSQANEEAEIIESADDIPLESIEGQLVAEETPHISEENPQFT